MSERIDVHRARQLVYEGVPVVDVLPAATFADVHLPGAMSVPLETFTPADVDHFDRAAALIVYCFDQH
jgi:phage shock protein E